MVHLIPIFMFVLQCVSAATNWLTGTVPDVQSEVTRINPGMNRVLNVSATGVPRTPEALPPPTVVSTLFNDRHLRKPVSETGVNGYSSAMKCCMYC